MKCICDWPKTCDGHGHVECMGCGGDFCICQCGGEDIECIGCEACDRELDDYGDYPEPETPTISIALTTRKQGEE